MGHVDVRVSCLGSMAAGLWCIITAVLHCCYCVGPSEMRFSTSSQMVIDRERPYTSQRSEHTKSH